MKPRCLEYLLPGSVLIGMLKKQPGTFCLFRSNLHILCVASAASGSDRDYTVYLTGDSLLL